MNRIFWLLALCLYVQGVSARQSLTLEEAVATGLANNFDIRIARVQAEASRQNNTWGQAGRWPSIGLLLSQNNGVSNVENPAAFLQGITINNAVNPALNLNWVLFDGFAVHIQKQRLEQLQAQTEGNATVVIETAVQGILLAYYQVLLEQERQRVLDENLKHSRERYTLAQLRRQVGSAVIQDVLLEEVNYLEDSLDCLNQQLAVRNAFRMLNVLLANPEVETTYTLTGALALDAPDYEAPELYARLETGNANLAQLYIAQKILQSEAALARSELYPTLSLNVGGAYNVNRQDLSQARFANGNVISDPRMAYVTNYNVNLTLAFNLFNGGRTRRAIENARIAEDIGQMQTERLLTTLRRDLSAALDLYKARKTQLSVARRREEAAAQQLAISGDKLNSGAINLFEYRFVQQTALSASLARLSATYQLIESHVQLTRLTGGILGERKENK